MGEAKSKKRKGSDGSTTKAQKRAKNLTSKGGSKDGGDALSECASKFVPENFERMGDYEGQASELFDNEDDCEVWLFQLPYQVGALSDLDNCSVEVDEKLNAGLIGKIQTEYGVEFSMLSSHMGNDSNTVIETLQSPGSSKCFPITRRIALTNACVEAIVGKCPPLKQKEANVVAKRDPEVLDKHEVEVVTPKKRKGGSKKPKKKDKKEKKAAKSKT